MELLEQRIAKIEQRNRSVELDKAWETSWMRRILIVVFTYAVIGVFLQFIAVPRPWINAFVPAIAFSVSTFTMRLIKHEWVARKK